MTIREATTEDVAAIQRVAEDSWEADYPNIMSRESLDEGVHDWYSTDRIRDSLFWSTTIMLVAEVDEEFVGFGHGDLIPEDEIGHILRVYVSPDARRRGIGGELLEAVCQRLFDEGASRIKATALASNELGDEFYRTFGFDPVGTEKVEIGGETYQETTYDLREEAMVSLASASVMNRDR